MQCYSLKIPIHFFFTFPCFNFHGTNTTAKDIDHLDKLKLPIGFYDDYEILRELGRGRYSVAFEGFNIVNHKRVVIKVLKPTKLRRIKREVKILQMLKECPFIVDIQDFIIDPGCKTPAIVYEYFDYIPWKERFHKLSPTEIKVIIFQILRALEYAHLQRIMHRDIKELNVIYNPKIMQIKVIDWGLAEFYHPEQEYSVRVASRYFKAPELLLNNTRYDYSIDIWSVGCIFAAMHKLFRKNPFFFGKDNFDQLAKINQVCGTDALMNYITSCKLNIEGIPNSALQKADKVELDAFITSKNSHLYNPDAIDLLSKMLVVDHRNRISARDALKHKYFREKHMI